LISVKKRLASLVIVLGVFAGTAVSARAASLQVNGARVDSPVTIYNGSAYVPLRAVTAALSPDASVAWENGRAVIRKSGLTVTARPGALYMEANDRALYALEGIKVTDGTMSVPLRAFAKAFGASAEWDGATGTAVVTAGSGTIQPGGSFYDADSVYWLSRIISAESMSEPLKGKIAVGNVILNRVRSPDFPNTIYGVIFDGRWGGQFQPVKNGTVYNTPTPDSVLAAKLCLDGASVVGDSLFFLNPAISSNFWATQNRDFIATIGNHEFYA
jgi:N-acetylmuramoyl-L-alanine amidase